MCPSSDFRKERFKQWPQSTNQESECTRGNLQMFTSMGERNKQKENNNIMSRWINNLMIIASLSHGEWRNLADASDLWQKLVLRSWRTHTVMVWIIRWYYHTHTHTRGAVSWNIQVLLTDTKLLSESSPGLSEIQTTSFTCLTWKRSVVPKTCGVHL